MDRNAIRESLLDSVRKLTPRSAARNPVMFTVLVGTIICAGYTVHGAFTHQPFGFALAVTLILLLTVLFANFAEAVAEARGRGQAMSLRSTRAELSARRLRADGSEEVVPATMLRKGDRVRVSVGEAIPADGEVVVGVASINEAAVTGESAPVLREAGDRPLRRDRRHHGAVRFHRGGSEHRSGRQLPRSHDRPGRGRKPAEDAERACPDRAARRADHRVPRGGGDAAGPGRVRQRARPMSSC